MPYRVEIFNVVATIMTNQCHIFEQCNGKERNGEEHNGEERKSEDKGEERSVTCKCSIAL